MPIDFAVTFEGRVTTATHYAALGAASPSAPALVLAHGAGAGHRHPFMTGFARGLADAGVHVVTFNFLYLEERRKVPDRTPVLEGCFRAVIEAARARADLTDTALILGGKSMGGRIATHLGAQRVERLQGLVALGYPLHPPGKPEQLRAAHLTAIRVPLLVVQGERDAFGTPAELEPVLARLGGDVTVHVVAGGDHSLAVRGQTPSQVYAPVIALIAGWIRARAT